VEGNECGLVEGQVLNLNGGTEAVSQSRQTVLLVEVRTTRLSAVSEVRRCGKEV